jgi:hypothetical protein
MFGPDGLSRQKWYPGDPLEQAFDDGSEDDRGTSGDFELIKEDPDDDNPLSLEAFYGDIDNQEGFLHKVIGDDPTYVLECQSA